MKTGEALRVQMKSGWLSE